MLENATDVDYFTFATPAGTKLSVFQGVIDGKVDFQLTLNGASFGPGETAMFGSGTVRREGVHDRGQARLVPDPRTIRRSLRPPPLQGGRWLRSG